MTFLGLAPHSTAQDNRSPRAERHSSAGRSQGEAAACEVLAPQKQDPRAGTKSSGQSDAEGAATVQQLHTHPK
ncbi:MAG: hypothetical protein ACPIOQ_04345 [Promethearchaeia archaeon]